MQKETDPKTKITYYQSKALNTFPFLRHGILSCHGELDLGQQASSLATNLDRVQRLTGSKYLAYTKQVHGTKILEVSSEKLPYQEEADAMITQEKDIALLIRHADCQAAIFVAPEKEVIANVHCGWRGNCLNIYKEITATFKKRFKVPPEELFVMISPSLGPSNSEFIHYKKEFPKEYWKYFTKDAHINLWDLSMDQLTQEGVPSSQITITGLCTFENPDFFSYRRDKTSKRCATWVALKL